MYTNTDALQKQKQNQRTLYISKIIYLEVSDIENCNSSLFFPLAQ